MTPFYYWLVEVTCFTIQITVKEKDFLPWPCPIYISWQATTPHVLQQYHVKRENSMVQESCVCWTMNLEGLDNCTVYNFSSTINILFALHAYGINIYRDPKKWSFDNIEEGSCSFSLLRSRVPLPIALSTRHWIMSLLIQADC